MFIELWEKMNGGGIERVDAKNCNEKVGMAIVENIRNKYGVSYIKKNYSSLNGNKCDVFIYTDADYYLHIHCTSKQYDLF